jgi:putative membrane protein insertion efficiency factor
MITLIKFYKNRISPMSSPRCKYIPTCSQYAIDAIEKYGILRGGFMACWRILKCNPFSKGGFDPVK